MCVGRCRLYRFYEVLAPRACPSRAQRYPVRQERHNPPSRRFQGAQRQRLTPPYSVSLNAVKETLNSGCLARGRAVVVHGGTRPGQLLYGVLADDSPDSPVRNVSVTLRQEVEFGKGVASQGLKRGRGRFEDTGLSKAETNTDCALRSLKHVSCQSGSRLIIFLAFQCTRSSPRVLVETTRRAKVEAKS